MRTSSFGLVLALAALPMGCTRAEPYLACSRSSPCGSDAPLCLSDTSPRGLSALFCTKRCTTPAVNSAECPAGGACIRLNGGDPVCVKKCTADADCDFNNAACLVRGESLGARVCAVRP